MVSYRQVCG